MSDNINPAWNGILGALPPDLHKLVIPELKKWDEGVQAKFDEIHKGYEDIKPFKQFLDNNISPEYAWQSVVFADELQKNPAGVAAQINENWNLGLVSQEDMTKAVEEAKASAESNVFDEDEDETKMDLSKNPEFLAMKQSLDAMQNSAEEERRKEQEEADIKAFEAELDALEKSVTQPEDGSQGKPFNRTFVTALMAQGVSADDAVKQFHLLLGQSVDTSQQTETQTGEQPPVTMGNGGTVGSGSGDESIDWNGMSTSAFNENIAKTLQAMQTDT